MIDELSDIAVATTLAGRCSRFDAVRADVDAIAGRWLPELRAAGYSEEDLARADFAVNRGEISKRTRAYMAETIGATPSEDDVCRAAEREIAAKSRTGSYLRPAEG